MSFFFPVWFRTGRGPEKGPSKGRCKNLKFHFGMFVAQGYVQSAEKPTKTDFGLVLLNGTEERRQLSHGFGFPKAKISAFLYLTLIENATYYLEI